LYLAVHASVSGLWVVYPFAGQLGQLPKVLALRLWGSPRRLVLMTHRLVSAHIHQFVFS